MRVSLLDEDPLTALMLEDFLTDLGHEVTIARCARDLLPQLEAAETGLVIVNLCLPMQNIEAMMHAIRLRYYRLKFIVIPPFIGEPDTGHPQASRHYGMLAKPVKLYDLERLINRLCHPEPQQAKPALVA